MAERHFFEQEKYAREYFLGYLKSNIIVDDTSAYSILEVGCAEGGMLSVLSQEGFKVKGLEISQGRVDIAKAKLDEDIDVTVGDISDLSTLDVSEKFDMVILRDVIEHVSDQKSGIDNMSYLVKDGGYLFITFPLKYSPYAGHQQNAPSWLKRVWYITLLPTSLIKYICRKANAAAAIDEIIYLKKHAMSYCRVKRLLGHTWKIKVKDFFISRPIYRIRFGWKIVKGPRLPVIRECVNGCELLLQKKKVEVSKKNVK